MIVLTPAERKAALLLTLLLLLGAGSDALRDRRPPRPHRFRATADSGDASALIPAADSASHARAAPPAADSSSRVDLNRATVRELDTLPGVGPVLAARIIDYRVRYGPFREPEDLRAVRGIGPKLFARLRDRVRAAPAP